MKAAKVILLLCAAAGLIFLAVIQIIPSISHLSGPLSHECYIFTPFNYSDDWGPLVKFITIPVVSSRGNLTKQIYKFARKILDIGNFRRKLNMFLLNFCPVIMRCWDVLQLLPIMWIMFTDRQLTCLMQVKN